MGVLCLVSIRRSVERRMARSWDPVSFGTQEVAYWRYRGFGSWQPVRDLSDAARAVFTTDKPISEQYGTKVLDEGEVAPAGAQTITTTYRGAEVTAVRGLLPLGTPVRLTTPFFNIYGLLTLVGGAIYSAYLFWRKRVMPNRVVANVLIAAGALAIGSASTLTRLGYGQYLYLGELISAIMMFAGFRLAAKPQPDEVIEMGTVPASAD